MLSSPSQCFGHLLTPLPRPHDRLFSWTFTIYLLYTVHESFIGHHNVDGHDIVFPGFGASYHPTLCNTIPSTTIPGLLTCRLERTIAVKADCGKSLATFGASATR